MKPATSQISRLPRAPRIDCHVSRNASRPARAGVSRTNVSPMLSDIRGKHAARTKAERHHQEEREAFDDGKGREPEEVELPDLSRRDPVAPGEHEAGNASHR